jgi:hypothetical protein
MRLIVVKHVTIRLKCGSGWSGSTERINGTDMGIKHGTDGDKMRPFNDATS